MSELNRWSFLLSMLIVASPSAGQQVASPSVSVSGGLEVRGSTDPIGISRAAAGNYLDVDGQPLPFATQDEVVDFLANAPIVAKKRIDRGISGTLKLTLERDGTRVHAAFRSVDVSLSASTTRAAVDRHRFRDCYAYEVAAYRLSRLLGLDRVPPAALRTVDGRRGSVQLWVENAITEADLLRTAAGRMNAERHLQRQTMLVFDNLIYNFDRHQNNMLYDEAGRLWYIDHTRSFKRLGELKDRDRIAVIRSDLLEHIKALDRKTVNAALGDLLDPIELAALERRKRLLVRHFDRLIAERSAENVLLPPPSDARLRLAAGAATRQPEPRSAREGR